MNLTGKFNDIAFAVIFIFYLASREWPFGGFWQSVLDVFMAVIFCLILYKYYVFNIELTKADDTKPKKMKKHKK